MCASYLTDALDAASASPGTPQATVIISAGGACCGGTIYLHSVTVCCLRPSEQEADQRLPTSRPSRHAGSNAPVWMFRQALVIQ